MSFEFLTETRDTGIMNTSFEGWIPCQGPIAAGRTAAPAADRTDNTTPYALLHLQPRGSPSTMRHNPAQSSLEIRTTF
jgi:GTP-binding protein